MASKRSHDGSADAAAGSEGNEQPHKKARSLTLSSYIASRPITALESRVEFTSDHLVAASRDSARCISVSLDIDKLFRDARVIYLTDDRASWIYYIPKWFRRIYNHCIAENELHVPYADWFQRVWDLHPKNYNVMKMFGKDVPIPRFQQMYGTTGRVTGIEYEYKPIPDEMDLVVRLLRAFVVSSRSNESYLTSLLINWFANGDHSIGAHSDDESQLHPNSPVFSLSLGATRRFVITPRANTSAPNPKKMELLLNDGDLVIMGGSMQRTHKHAVPKMKKSAGKRMSITMRCYK